MCYLSILDTHKIIKYIRNAWRPSTKYLGVKSYIRHDNERPWEVFLGQSKPWPNSSPNLSKIKSYMWEAKQRLPTQTATSSQLRRKPFNCPHPPPKKEKKKTHSKSTYSCTSHSFRHVDKPSRYSICAACQLDISFAFPPFTTDLLNSFAAACTWLCVEIFGSIFTLHHSVMPLMLQEARRNWFELS